MNRRIHRLAAALAAGAFAAGSANALEILVPAYFYPSFDPAQSQWDEMQAALAAGVKVTAIMNPANGPGAAPNADYTAAVNAFRAAGGRVLGYVFTCYGDNTCVDGKPATRSVGDVLADVQRYADGYTVDGIFLDEMGGDASLSFYAQVTQALRAAHPGWQIVGNPGAAIPEASAAQVDTVVTFEQGRGDYTQATSAPWMTGADPQRQAHLHYNVGSSAQMRSLLEQAVERGAGYVYVTDDRYVKGDPVDTNPFDRLPSYWAEEVAAVAALNAVPEPAPWALGVAGAGALLLSRRRRQV